MNEQSEVASKRRQGAAASAVLIFVPWVAIMLCGLYNWHGEYLIGKRAETTTGTITKIELNSHGQYDFEYLVGGVTYKGGQVIMGDERMFTGDQVRVSYDPLNPSRSTLTTFGETGSRPVPLLLLTVLAVVFYFRLRTFLGRSLSTPD